MYIVFFLAVAVLVIIGIMAVVPSILSKPKASLGDREFSNLHVARQRLEELDRSVAAGERSAEEANQIRQEVEQALLDDVESDPKIKPKFADAISQRGNLRAAIAVAVLIPFVSGSLYLMVGEPVTIILPQHGAIPAPPDSASLPVDREPTMEEMVEMLETRLFAAPNDPQGWTTLAQAYVATERFADAVSAYRRVRQLIGDNAGILVREADALGMVQGGTLAGEPSILLERALELEPDHPGGLWLAGLAASENGQLREALVHWSRAAELIDNPEIQTELQRLITTAETELGDSSSNPPPAATATGSVRVQVSVDPSIEDNLDPTDTLFVLARAINGPRAPLAAVKLTVNDLPLSIELNDSMSMLPNLKLSDYQDIEVIARVSKSGQPLAGEGDLEGRSQVTRNGTDAFAEIVISQVVGNSATTQ